jgi:hypothetical protein
MRALTLRAGPEALRHIRERGLQANDVRIIPAASGGAKWLSIAGLDRFLFAHFLSAPRDTPLHLVGSSIGSWRMACLAQVDSLSALDRGHHAYIHDQHYSASPGPAKVAAVLSAVLDTVLGERGVDEILSHRWFRTHIVTAQGRGLARDGSPRALTAALLVAGALNIAARRTLSWQFTRTIFSSASDRRPFATLNDLPTRFVALTRDNLRDALRASGSIPLVIDGVSIPSAPGGLHWDGGVTDYHLDLAYEPTDGLVLFPHFYPHVVPGWFDKSLPWRRATGTNFSRALLLAPSAEFVATLPGGRIPDRRDFRTFPPAERIARWEAVRTASTALGDELGELLTTGRIAERLQPWRRER